MSARGDWKPQASIEDKMLSQSIASQLCLLLLCKKKIYTAYVFVRRHLQTSSYRDLEKPVRKRAKQT